MGSGTIHSGGEDGKYGIMQNFMPVDSLVESMENSIDDLRILWTELENRIIDINNDIDNLNSSEIEPLRLQWLDAVKRAGIKLDLG